MNLINFEQLLLYPSIFLANVNAVEDFQDPFTVNFRNFFDDDLRKFAENFKIINEN